MHHFCDKLLRKMQGERVSGHFVSHAVGGVLQECYVTKRGYQLERDKLLRGGGGGVKIATFSVTYFLNDPLNHDM